MIRFYKREITKYDIRSKKELKRESSDITKRLRMKLICLKNRNKRLEKS